MPVPADRYNAAERYWHSAFPVGSRRLQVAAAARVNVGIEHEMRLRGQHPAHAACEDVDDERGIDEERPSRRIRRIRHSQAIRPRQARFRIDQVARPIRHGLLPLCSSRTAPAPHRLRPSPASTIGRAYSPTHGFSRRTCRYSVRGP